MNEVESMTELMHTTVNVWPDVTYEEPEQFTVAAYCFLMSEYKWSEHEYGWRPWMKGFDYCPSWITRD